MADDIDQASEREEQDRDLALQFRKPEGQPLPVIAGIVTNLWRVGGVSVTLLVAMGGSV